MVVCGLRAEEKATLLLLRSPLGPKLDHTSSVASLPNVVAPKLPALHHTIAPALCGGTVQCSARRGKGACYSTSSTISVLLPTRDTREGVPIDDQASYYATGFHNHFLLPSSRGGLGASSQVCGGTVQCSARRGKGACYSTSSTISVLLPTRDTREGVPIDDQASYYATGFHNHFLLPSSRGGLGASSQVCGGTVQCSARRGKGACYSTSSTISVLLPTRDTREGVPIDDQASYYATGFHNHFLLPSSRGGLGASSQVCGGTVQCSARRGKGACYSTSSTISVLLPTRDTREGVPIDDQASYYATGFHNHFLLPSSRGGLGASSQVCGGTVQCSARRGKGACYSTSSTISVLLPTRDTREGVPIDDQASYYATGFHNHFLLPSSRGGLGASSQVCGGTVQCSARRGKGACYSTSSTISVLLPTRDTREGVPIDDQASYYATGFHNHFLLPSSRGGLGASSQVCGGTVQCSARRGKGACYSTSSTISVLLPTRDTREGVPIDDQASYYATGFHNHFLLPSSRGGLGASSQVCGGTVQCSARRGKGACYSTSSTISVLLPTRDTREGVPIDDQASYYATGFHNHFLLPSSRGGLGASSQVCGGTVQCSARRGKGACYSTSSTISVLLPTRDTREGVPIDDQASYYATGFHNHFLLPSSRGGLGASSQVCGGTVQCSARRGKGACYSTSSTISVLLPTRDTREGVPIDDQASYYATGFHNHFLLPSSRGGLGASSQVCGGTVQCSARRGKGACYSTSSTISVLLPTRDTCEGVPIDDQASYYATGFHNHFLLPSSRGGLGASSQVCGGTVQCSARRGKGACYSTSITISVLLPTRDTREGVPIDDQASYYATGFHNHFLLPSSRGGLGASSQVCGGTVQCSARRGKGACYSTSSTISVLLPTRDTREGVPIDDQASYYATGFHNHFLLPSSRGGLGASSQVCGGTVQCSARRGKGACYSTSSTISVLLPTRDTREGVPIDDQASYYATGFHNHFLLPSSRGGLGASSQVCGGTVQCSARRGKGACYSTSSTISVLLPTRDTREGVPIDDQASYYATGFHNHFLLPSSRGGLGASSQVCGGTVQCSARRGKGACHSTSSTISVLLPTRDTREGVPIDDQASYYATGFHNHFLLPSSRDSVRHPVRLPRMAVTIMQEYAEYMPRFGHTRL